MAKPKLNFEKVAEVRKMLLEGITQTEIAKHFKVSLSIIGRVKNGQSWIEEFRHLREENMALRNLKNVAYNRISATAEQAIKDLLLVVNSQSQVARLLGISPSTVSRVKSEMKEPKERRRFKR